MLVDARIKIENFISNTHPLILFDRATRQLVATDMHRLVIMPVTLSANELQIFNKLKYGIRPEVFIKARKLLPKSYKVFDIELNSDFSCTVVASDITIKGGWTNVEDDYLDYSKVYPDLKGCKTVGLDFKLLKGINLSRVEIKIPKKKNKPLLLETADEQHGDPNDNIKILLMPLVRVQ